MEITTSSIHKKRGFVDIACSRITALNVAVANSRRRVAVGNLIRLITPQNTVGHCRIAIFNVDHPAPAAVRAGCAVHDAVRCCVTNKWIDDCFALAAKTGAAMLACPVSATIKKVKDNIITETIDRSGLYEAQTPQVFEASLLKKAYENLKNLDKNKISDDSQLVEALGHKVSIVETDSSNIKITQKNDVAIAQAILKTRAKAIPKGYIGPYEEAQW